MLKISSNLSLMYRDLPGGERFAAAARDGYDDVESWWPWPETPTPSATDVEDFLDGLSAAGLTLRALNLFAGDMPGGVRGVLSHPDATEAFRSSVPVVLAIARATGCRFFNGLYGQRLPGVDLAQQDDTAVENLAFAAHALAEIGGTVVLEPLKHPDNGDYPLQTLDDAERIRRRVLDEHGERLGLLFDTFHLAGNGVDLVGTIHEHAEHIAHVQYADYPGRGAPGTGGIDFVAVTEALEEVGYSGFIGAEFIGGREPVPLSSVRSAIEATVEA